MLSVGPQVDAPAKKHKARTYLRRLCSGKIRVGKPWGPKPQPSRRSQPGLRGEATATAAAAAVNQLTPVSTAVTFAATVAKNEGEGNAQRFQARRA